MVNHRRKLEEWTPKKFRETGYAIKYCKAESVKVAMIRCWKLGPQLFEYHLTALISVELVTLRFYRYRVPRIVSTSSIHLLSSPSLSQSVVD